MGSLPDSKYIIQTDGYWFVEAHDVDPSKGYISVSAKGIVNGLSNQPNDGADFGPDTYDPNYSGSGIPYTSTTGIAEAWNYAFSAAKSYPQASGQYLMPPIQLLDGFFEIKKQVLLSPSVRIMNPKMIGLGSMSTYVGWNFDDAAILIDHTNPNIVYSNIELGYMQPIAETGTGSNSSFFSAPYVSGDPAYQTNPFQSYDLDFSNTFSGIAGLYLTGMKSIICYNLQSYDGGTYGGLYCDNTQETVAIYGGIAGAGAYISNVSYAYVDFDGTLNTLDLNNVSSLIIPSFGIYNGINLHGNTGLITILTMSSGETAYAGGKAMFQLSGVSSATVDGLVVGYFNGSYAQTYNLVSGNVTVKNVRVHNVELVSGASLSGWHNTPSTPSVPASGTAQSNSNPYPVNVYLYGGTVTVIDYTPSGGSSTQVGTTGPATVRLNPGDSITLTYSAAPTWNWVAV